MKQAISSGTVAEKLDAPRRKCWWLMIWGGQYFQLDKRWSFRRHFAIPYAEQLRSFSSNIALNDLETTYLTINNRGEADPLKAKRLMERLRYLTKEIQIKGRNRRNP